MTELSPNELMIRLTGILQEKIDKDGQPFDFYSPDNPSLVLYPHQIQAITFGYMKPEELPQAASNPKVRSVVFKAGKFETRDPKLAAALARQDNIKPGMSWFLKAMERAAMSEQEQKAKVDAKLKAETEEKKRLEQEKRQAKKVERDKLKAEVKTEMEAEAKRRGRAK